MPHPVLLPKVSVIVPVYNVAAYLPRCLDSLVNQTLEEIEILCINDGSTDSSGEILQAYAARFPKKIQVIEKKNGGLSDARNAGIDRAAGAYLAFVDSDDYVAETMLEKLHDLATYHGAEIAICTLQKVDEDEKPGQTLVQMPNFPEAFALKDRMDAFSDMSYFACNKLFHRSLFSAHRFSVGVHFEDIDLIPRLVLQCSTLAQTQEVLYFYRERSDSISRTHTLRGLDILKACEKVAKEFQASGLANYPQALTNFLILEGVYTFLAYAAFVKNPVHRQEMQKALDTFKKKYRLSFKEILGYSRFGKNYFLSLSLPKKLYYLLCFTGLWQAVASWRRPGK